MTQKVTVRNTINGERLDVDLRPGRTVRETVADSGLINGEFSVRDKNGQVVDDREAGEFSGQVLNVGFPAPTVIGG